MSIQLDRMEDVSDLYKLLLKILKTNPNENYCFTDRDKKLLLDQELFNQIQIDSIAMLVLYSTENKLNKEPSEKIFKSLFNLEYSSSEDIKENLKQIRNCFGHALTFVSIDGEKIIFNNGKIKGNIRLDQLVYLCMLYNSGRPRIVNLIDGVVDKKIKNDEDIDKIIKRGRVFIFDDEYDIDALNSYANQSYMYAKYFLDWKNMSPTQINKHINNTLKDKHNFKIRRMDEYEKNLRAYIEYIDKDNFYNLDYEAQKEIIKRVVSYQEDDEENHVNGLTTICVLIMAIQDTIKKGKNELDFNNVISEKSDLYLLINKCTFPFLYEEVLSAYIYSRFIYLKELLNTNQIDNSIINYDGIQIDDIQPQLFYSKKEVAQRKKAVENKIENLKRDIDELERSIDKLKTKIMKNSNSKSPNRKEIQKDLERKINEKQNIILKYKTNKENLENEFEYIKNNNKMMCTPNMLFKLLRNASVHNLNISPYSRITAYQQHNLGCIYFNFTDMENGKKKANLTIKAERLERLIDDIEQSTIINIKAFKLKQQDSNNGEDSNLKISFREKIKVDINPSNIKTNKIEKNAIKQTDKDRR